MTETARTMPARTAADEALDLVQDGSVIGLGSGRVAGQFLRKLGARVASGLKVRGVPTSLRTAALAKELGIPLADLSEVPELDIAFDGADEVDPFLDLIKGYGGSLVREKVVASAARRVVILIGPPSESAAKMVQRLGSRGRLPVEVIPFAAEACRRGLMRLGLDSSIRQDASGPVTSDNGNLILDARIEPVIHPAGLERAIRSIAGVVGTGLFLGMADLVLIDTVAGLERQARPGRE